MISHLSTFLDMYGNWHEQALSCKSVSLVSPVDIWKLEIPVYFQSDHVHDDVMKWKHFPRYWPFVWGIHRCPVNSPHKWPVTRSFDVFFDLRLNKQLSKQWWGWWFDTLSCPLWRHRNGLERSTLTRWVTSNLLICQQLTSSLNLHLNWPASLISLISIHWVSIIIILKVAGMQDP